MTNDLDHWEIFELTAGEVAAMDDDLVFEYLKRREYRFASMNSRDQERMLDAMVAENGIKGGWFWQAVDCRFGPFATRAEALEDMQKCEA